MTTYQCGKCGNWTNGIKHLCTKEDELKLEKFKEDHKAWRAQEPIFNPRLSREERK